MKNHLIKSALNFVPHLIFFALEVLAVVYFKERTLLIDNAGYLFKLINEESINYENRWGAAISQFLPYFGIKLHLSLKLIMLTYSLSHIIVFYGCYLLVHYVIKNRAAGIAIVLVQLLFIRDSFYFAVSEAHHVMVYCIVFYAWIEQKSLKKWTYWVGTILLFLLCYTTHPTSALFIPFIILFSFLTENKKKKETIYLIAGILSIYVFRLLITPSNQPEGAELSRVKDTFEYIPKIFAAKPLHFFIKHLWMDSKMFLLSTLCLVVSIGYYVWHKKLLKLFLIIGAFGGYMLLNSIIYYNGESGLMLSKSWVSLSLFVALPLADILFKLPLKYGQLILLIIAVIQLRDMAMVGSKKYSKKIKAVQEIVDQTQYLYGHKFFINESALSDEIDRSRLPIQTLLLSRQNNELKSVTVLPVPNNNKTSLTINPENFIRDMDALQIHESFLNPNYFELKGVYEELH